MKIKRREFIKKSAIAGGLAGLGVRELLASPRGYMELYQGEHIQVLKPGERRYYEPLEEVYVNVELFSREGTIQVMDGQGNRYLNMPYKASFSFQAGGALGYHIISVYDEQEHLVDWAAFPVDCETCINDDKGLFSDFTDILYNTLTTSTYHYGTTVRYNQKYYTYYSSWLQDHVFVAEGMKYFAPDLKTGIDLYADGQRSDGLIWDNYKHPYPDIQSYWEYRFNYGGFTYRPEDPRSSAIFVRIPVENIGEHTFIEGLYYAWKATGDTEWMKTRLDHALKAVDFATSSPYYWSEEKQLLKRPFTIDRWDFQSDYDAEITGRDFMGVDLEKTRFGIMFGDNICMASACELLSEMLNTAGRKEDAERMKNLGRSLWQRINELSWKGDFYRHWYPLNPERKVDFGVDTSEQVTLSNAMALIRGLDHEKCVKIIQTYRRIRKEMPESSPGEWYMCYPPFEKGWHINKWEYMNGGVSSILAGDLALGAFNHGYESYGADILKRLYELAQRSDYEMKGCYKGRMPEEPERNFTLMDLRNLANTDLVGGNEDSPNGWIGGEIADFRNLPVGRQDFAGIPFEVIDPALNNRKACLAIGKDQDNQGEVILPVNQKARSLYLLHTMDGSGVAGTLYIHYADETYHVRHIAKSVEIGHFWYPEIEESRKGIPTTKVAWKGPSREVKEVGNYAFGMDNPHPEKTISHLEFSNPKPSSWVVFAVTLSDGPHYFKPTIVSTIPNHWGSAHVLKALIEGLAGIKNTGLAFDKAVLSPRWEAAGIKKVKATAKYEASGGYLAYNYRKQSPDEYEVEFSGNSMETELQFLIPAGRKIKDLLVNGKSKDYSIRKIENSRYACVLIRGAGVKKLQFRLM